MNKNIIYLALVALIIVIAGVGAYAYNNSNNIKELQIQSFVVFENNQPKPQFNPKEITVKKGDKVRLKITNTAGTHDFKIDELNIYTDTPLNQEQIIEFTADRAGEFVYYCTKPGHRQNGQWGTLKVME